LIRIRHIAKSILDGVRELRAQPRVFFTLCALAYILMFTYGLARPPAKSMFTEIYGASVLPLAWLAVAVVTVAGASLYGHLVSRVPTPRLFLGATLVFSVLFTSLCIANALAIPHAVFALYVLMETYIVILVESFWSLANLTHRLTTARVAYGVFLLCGSFGTLSAELLQPELAYSLGTEQIPWLVAPILIICGVWCNRLGRERVTLAVEQDRSPPDTVSRRAGWQLILRSRYLWLLVPIVASSQILINIADYTLTATFQATYAGEALRDARTAAFGTVYATISASAIVLQLFTAPIVTAFGVLPILLAIPTIVGAAVTAAWAVPRALVSSIAFVSAKAFDYSLFRACKEMLYLPLDARSKTVGKSYVDMATYRSAKAGASFLLLALGSLGMGAIGGTTVGLALAWLGCTVLLAPRYRAELQRARGN
jgi:ATP/ADP translocase